MNNLTPSQSHYIKAVYELSSGGCGARVVDIAEKLVVSKASVSHAMQKLLRLGYVQQDAARHLYLTGEGERQAVLLLDKHSILKEFLTGVLDVGEAAAQQDACALEHIISMDTLCAICRLTSKLRFEKQCTGACPLPKGLQASCKGTAT